MHTQHNNTHKITTPTQDNYNNTHGQTNNNYTQDDLKLATIHARQTGIQHVQKVKTPK